MADCPAVIWGAQEASGYQHWATKTISGRQVLEVSTNPAGLGVAGSGVGQFGLGDEMTVEGNNVYGQGGNLHTIPQIAESTLRFPFTLANTCDVRVMLYGRAYDTSDGADRRNDLWLRIADGSDVGGEKARGDHLWKAYAGNDGNFKWLTIVEGEYWKTLNAGTHTLEISARAFAFQFERAVIMCADGSCTFNGTWNNSNFGEYGTGITRADVEPSAGLDCAQSTWSAGVTEPPAEGCTDCPQAGSTIFNNATDLLVMHHDFAGDRDDGHAVVANKMIVDTHQINDWIVTSGTNSADLTTYRSDSEAVMQATFGNNWAKANINTPASWNAAVDREVARWVACLNRCGDVWVADAGQEDFSVDVLQAVANALPGCNISERVHIVQHSQTNINNTSGGNHTYLVNNTDYHKIDDGNAPNNNTADLHANNQTSSQNSCFTNAARASDWGSAWDAAFNFLPPGSDLHSEGKLDFSDTVEVLWILGVSTGSVGNWNDFINVYGGGNC